METFRLVNDITYIESERETINNPPLQKMNKKV
jgi:hypothetical protein